MTDIVDRQPPHDTGSEEQLLGGLIVDGTKWIRVAGVVSGADFYDKPMGRIFDAVVSLAQAGKAVSDIGFLTRQLAVMGVTVLADLRRLASYDGLSAHVLFHAERVRRCANLRRLIESSVRTLESCYDSNASDSEIAAAAKAALEGVNFSDAQAAESFGEVAERVMLRLRQPPELIAGQSLMTGLRSLDELAGAMRPGELVIIAARPGCGKTSLAMQIAEHNAAKGRRCLFVSLEMTADELVTRTLASHAEVESRVIRNGAITPIDVTKMGGAAADMHSTPIQIWAPGKAKVIGIEAMAKIVAAQPGGLAAIFVDYIGLVEPDNRRDERHEQVAAISQALKRIAKDVRVPVIAPCQLTREADKTVPMLSHLAESSGIEKDADMVWFIHLPDGRHKLDHESMVKADLLVAKHRHGGTGRIEVRFNPRLTRFCEPSHEWRPPHGQ